MYIVNGSPRKMKNNPATVELETGRIIINPFIWDKLTDWEKAIILLHEEGHYNNQSISEVKADLYAIKKFAGTEQSSLRKLLDTFDRFIPFHEEGNKRRIEFVRNLLYFDINANNNKDSQILLDEINRKYPTTTANVEGAADISAIIDKASVLIEPILKLIKTGIDKYNAKWGGAWSKTESKDQLMIDAVALACYVIYYENGGDYDPEKGLKAIDNAATKPYSDPRSLFYKTYLTLVSIGAFVGDLRDVNKTNNSFWKSNSSYDLNYMIKASSSVKSFVIDKAIQDKTLIDNTVRRKKMITVVCVFAVLILITLLTRKKHE